MRGGRLLRVAARTHIERRKLRRECNRARLNGQRRLIDAPELFGAGMHMHQLLLRRRHIDQRVG
jgi:hypothetical protein